MKVNPNGVGVENYVDSPVFIEIVLALAAITFGSIAWLELRKPHGSVLVSLALAASALLCIVGMLAQKRRTFLFDTSARTLTWASRGLRERAAGTADFKDVRITLEPSTDDGHTNYRIIVSTPDGSWPLTTSYDANQGRIQAQAARLRALLGQPAEGLLDDSVAQLTKDRKRIAAALLLGQQQGVSTTEAFKSIVESQKSKPDSM
jgi:hypothetical protein